ncbi:unnamed protein product [Calypogeia fissa]
MFRALDIIAPEILSRNLIKRCTSFSAHCYEVKGNLSFGRGKAFSGSSFSMASTAAAVREDRSNGECAESSWSAASSVAFAGKNPFSASNGLVNGHGNGQSSGVDVPSDRNGGGKEMLLRISQEGIPSAPDNFADTSSLPSTDEVRRCDCSDARGAEGKDEEDSFEGGEGFTKRLRTEEVQVSIPDQNDFERRIARAWEHWRKLGAPKMHVAPMVDQSELPFRMLCRKYGATAAYTPMLHARLFAQDGKYRTKEFSTCPEDRPLFVQFCANNPDVLLEAARLVEPICDYVDINLGCPQRIAKKGYYGAFLMDNLPLVKSLVSKLASNLTVPVSCKIRVFPDLEDTLAYARMLEEAGCSLLAVHGRTRDQKDGKAIRADWDAIRAVKQALRIPVLGNGNIRWVEDVHACIAYTGVDGVMSAESLLENPALFAGYRPAHTLEDDNPEEGAGDQCSTGETTMEQPQEPKIDERALMLEYLNLCEKYPVPMRMVRGHVHKTLGNYWFKRNPDIRQELNKQHILTVEWLKAMVYRLMTRPPCMVPPPTGTKDAEEAVAAAVLPPLEISVKTLASGSPAVLPLLTSENVRSVS